MLILFFCKYIFSILYFYFLGKLIRSFFTLSFRLNLLNPFFNVLIGLLTTTYIYSIFKSEFKTSLSVGLIIFVYFFVYNRLKFRFFYWETIPFKKGLFPLLVISSLVFFYQANFYFDYSHNQIKHLFVDNYTYANIVSILHDYGVENIDYPLNQYLPFFQNEFIPYRYADLWLSSFLMDLIKVKDIESFYLFSTPILISVSAYLYFLMIFDKISNLFFSILTSTILLFLSIAFIPVLNSIYNLNYLSETSVMGVYQQKLSFSMIFFILGFYIWKIDRLNSYLFIIFVPILCVTYIPAIWGSVVILSILSFLKKIFKLNYCKSAIRLVFPMFFLMFFYWLFYQVNGSFYIDSDNKSFLDIPIVKRLPKELINESTTFNLKSFLSTLLLVSIPEIFFYLKGAIGNLIIGTLFYIPFFILLYRKLALIFSELKFLVIILIVGMFFVVLKDGDVNNYQFYSSCLIIISILLSLLFIESLDKSVHIFMFLITISVFNLFPIVSLKYKFSEINIDNEFIENVEKKLAKNKKATIFCMLNEKSFDRNFYSWVGVNALFPLKQKFNNNISFSVINPEVFFVLNDSNQIDYTYKWNLFVNLKNKRFKHLENRIRYKMIKFIYVKNKVHFPDDLSVLYYKPYISSNGDRFYVKK